MDYIETVPFSYFIDELMLLDGLPEKMAEDYIRTALIDFCTRSQVLRRSSSFCLIGCADEYALDIPDCERVVSIQDVCGGYRVLSHEPCETNCHGRYVWFVPPNNIKVSPVPTESGGEVRVVAAVTPTQDSCEVDKLVYERYRETVINKALSLLYLVKNARWFDANLAEYHNRLYREGLTQAGIDRIVGVRRGKFKMKSGMLYG